MHIMRILASLVIATAIPLAACSSAGETGSVAADPSRSGSSAPSPTASAEARTCISSSEGPELTCTLEAGTYTTAYLEPQLTYTVPAAGWGSLNREVSPGNFHLFPPGGSMAGFNDGTSDAISVVSAVAPPGTCTGQPSDELAPTFDGLVQFLRSDDHVVIRDDREVSVGGWDGVVMDITFAESDGCPDGDYTDLMIGVDPSHGAFGITPSMAGARLYLLHVPNADTALAIEVDDAAGGGSELADGEAWFSAAQSVIDTFVFAP